jgi:hypothetical protein
MSAFLDVIVYMFLSYLGLRFLQGINILPKFLSEKRYDILEEPFRYQTSHSSNNDNTFSKVKLSSDKKMHDIYYKNNKNKWNQKIFKKRVHVSTVIDM